MASACKSCGSFLWHTSRSRVRDGVIVESCSDCDRIEMSGSPDVYFREPYLEEHMGPEPIFISSRQEKVRIMKERGIVEAGDRRRGASHFDPIAHRHAMASLTRNNRG